MTCVPVVMSAYSGKKGGIAFVLNLSEGGVVIENVSDWFGQKGALIGSLDAVDASKVSGLSNGEHHFDVDVSGFEIDGESLEDSLSPNGTAVSVSSGRWSTGRAAAVKYVRDEGYEATNDNGNPSGLKLSYMAKTGLFRGSFNVFGETDDGKAKKRTATVSGAVVNGVGYGSAYIKRVGGVPVTVE